MHKKPILTYTQAAELVKDGDTITVSSSSGLNCPDLVLRGIGERFSQTGSPQNITSINPIAAGDMYGQPGIDHIAHKGLLKRVIAGSYPSGPSSATPPKIWQMIEAEEVEAYNFPSGVVFQLHRAAATGQPGVMSPVGLGTYADPQNQGGRMNETTPAELVENSEVGGKDYLFYLSVIPDVAIIRATYADENGNLSFEEEGSPLGALDQALAAHNNGGTVIAQVRQVVQSGSIAPQQVRVPGILIDAIVVDPDQLQTTETPYSPEISGKIRTPLDPFHLEHSTTAVIARRAAAELREAPIVNLGFGVSALVPHLIADAGLHGMVSWVLEQGPIGGLPLLDFKFGCSQNPDAIMQSADQFTLLQGGGFDLTLLSFLEIDAEGSVNVHYLPGRRHVTAGVGGFADITTHAKKIVFMGSFTAGRTTASLDDQSLNIEQDGPHTKLVKKVSQITFSGKQARLRGQDVTYITERCVLKLRDDGLEVVEIAPGVDLQKDVLDRSEFELKVSPDLQLMDSQLFSPDFDLAAYLSDAEGAKK